MALSSPGPRRTSPSICAAAARAAGRPRPQVVVGVLAAVTDEPDQVRAQVRERFAGAGELPRYRAMLEHEGVDDFVDVMTIGSEADVTAQLRRLEEAGATEVSAAVVGDPATRRRTTDLLTSLSDVGRG